MNLEIFVEQAEYIDTTSFLNWSIDHPQEKTIIKKLTSSGAKLIKGPRGCGKTTLILKAFNKLCKSSPKKTLPIYVNFKSSLKLEPLYRNNANAVYWFNQWLLFKIYQGIYSVISDLKIDPPKEMKFNKEYVDKITSQLELGKIDIIKDDKQQLTLHDLENDILRIVEILGGKRCVLFLDDAAHAFSSEQQQDFFDFFRKIKSKYISPKAAIYPGVTTYSSSFHAGHDAEEIDVWIKPDSSEYLNFMKALIKKRLPLNVYQEFLNNENLLSLICFAANGIPRALLNMISYLYKVDEENDANYQLEIERTKTLKAIKICFENTYAVYKSLMIKLPIYEKFIDTGNTVFEKIVTTIKDINKRGKVSKQSTQIALKRPIEPELSKVLGFFQYSGLLMPYGDSSRGGKGVYEIYSIHYAAIVERNVFFSKRAINVNDYITAFVNRPNHFYPRLTTKTLLGNEDITKLFSLALPPCEVCKTPRISDDAKFCANCGSKLKSASIFESIVNRDIKNLPLTVVRVNAIKSNSRIDTIKDILMDHDNKELRSVPQIGPVWAMRIRSYAEEFIA